MSVVNSEMYERCLVCRGERSAELDKAPRRGLWSVQTMKGWLALKMMAEMADRQVKGQ